MEVEMDISLYAMGPTTVVHPVHDFIEVLREHDCKVENTSMSLVVTGESKQVFDALRIGYESAAEKGGCVLIVKACNVCQL